MTERLGAVRFDREERIDVVLEAVIRQLKAEGLRIAGFIQRATDGDETSRSSVQLESIRDGRRFPVMQPLGAKSTGCRLDPRAMADLCGLASLELQDGVDLLILNRFGRGEADGEGLRSVIEEAFQREIPLLAPVRDVYWKDWLTFSGGWGDHLPVDEQAIVDWCRRATTLATGDSGAKVARR